MERAPNISARCEMDLSPGTLTRPESGPDLAAASIGMILAETVEEFVAECERERRAGAIEPRRGLAVNSQSPPGMAGLFAFDTNIIHAYAESHFPENSA